MATPPPRYSDESHHGDIELGVIDSKGLTHGDKDALLAGDAETGKEQPAPVSLKLQIFGYATLLVALLGVSSIGMVALLLDQVPATLVGSWRAQATALFMVPFFGYQVGQMIRAGTLRSAFSWRALLLFFYASFGGALWGGLFFLALNYTSLAHALLFDNALCIVIVAYKLIRREPTKALEVAGTVLGITGAGLSLVGGANDGVERDILWVLLGDGLCVIGCFGGILYLYAGRELRSHMPLFVYMLPLSIVSGVVMFALSYFFEGTSSGYGCFDWLTAEMIGPAVYLGVVTGLFGYVGYIACLKWVPPLVVTVVVLLEPPVGAVMGVVFGATGMLDVWTIVGGCILVVGTVLVTVASFPDSNKKQPSKAALYLRRVGSSALMLFGRKTADDENGNGAYATLPTTDTAPVVIRSSDDDPIFYLDSSSD